MNFQVYDPHYRESDSVLIVRDYPPGDDHDYLPTEKVKVSLNTMRSARNEFLVFIRQNNYKCSLNTVSDRLRSVTNMIKKDWMVVEKSAFKTLCNSKSSTASLKMK